MKTSHTNRGRKPGSYFDKVCNYINKLGPNVTFSSKEARIATGLDSERLCYILIFLKDANVIKRTARGVYKTLTTIPNFVTYNMLEANRGYLHYSYDKNSNLKSRERGPKWKAGDPNPYLTQNDEVLDNFIEEAVKGAVPSKAEIEASLPEPSQVQEKFPSIGEKILKNSTYGMFSNNHFDLNVPNIEAVVNFKFKPGDKVFYIEFNKVCSSNVYKIEMLWKSDKCEISYTTSHGQYPIQRLFANKEDLILSLLED
jgi:hypothetical protein